MRTSVDLSPRSLVAAYLRGVFPMADGTGRVYWYKADPRGIIPLDAFHVPKSLAQFMRSRNFPFEVRINTAFEATMRACMECRAGNTWISEELIAAYVRLHRLGLAHSVEVWRNGELAGGLYGVALGAAFFGESMFHRQRDASKVALVKLVERLRQRDFRLLDAQACTPHLKRFGCIEISAADYRRLLWRAVLKRRTFD